jgi:hypothetical protein
VDPGRHFWDDADAKTGDKNKQTNVNAEQNQNLLTEVEARSWLQDMHLRFSEVYDAHGKMSVFPKYEADVYEQEVREMYSSRVHMWRRVLGKYPEAKDDPPPWRWKGKLLGKDGKTFSQKRRYGPAAAEDLELHHGVPTWIDHSDGQRVCRNPFPVYSRFQGAAHFLHLYKLNDEDGTIDFFSTTDKIQLTKSMVDDKLDLTKMQHSGFIDKFMCLHNPQLLEGGSTTLARLEHVWVTPWKISAKQHRSEVHGPNRIKTSGVSNGNRPRPSILRPFCQPLPMIHDYFGSKVALYFAWLGFYTYSLGIPAVLGTALYIAQNNGILNGGNAQIAVSIFMCLWGVTFNKLWRREEKMCALTWGTLGVEEQQPTRPNFVGQLKRSSITDLQERYFPSARRARIKFTSYVVVASFVVFLVAAMGFMFDLKAYLGDPSKPSYRSWGASAVSAMQAAQIQILAIIFDKVAVRLNNWEVGVCSQS